MTHGKECYNRSEIPTVDVFLWGLIVGSGVGWTERAFRNAQGRTRWTPNVRRAKVENPYLKRHLRLVS